MIVQCFDALLMVLSFVDAPQTRSGEKHCPFIHLDRYLGGAWASVYGSSSSRIIVMFARVAKKDKVELERQLRDEKAAYARLACVAGWAVPVCYGEYLWYGGRSLVLSDEGPSLTSLGMDFAALGLIERLVLFGKLYLIHSRGVYHYDFEPRSVLRKGWCRLTIMTLHSRRSTTNVKGGGSVMSWKKRGGISSDLTFCVSIARSGCWKLPKWLRLWSAGLSCFTSCSLLSYPQLFYGWWACLQSSQWTR